MIWKSVSIKKVKNDGKLSNEDYNELINEYRCSFIMDIIGIIGFNAVIFYVLLSFPGLVNLLFFIIWYLISVLFIIFSCMSMPSIFVGTEYKAELRTWARGNLDLVIQTMIIIIIWIKIP